ncbi:lipopolysaccharide biosynthesis protein [Mucilaginibacter antarcticus]|uniref:Lipopolysaccharide biosynthesis protein n=1 Tax=Mucilaginibacter antarcticus TaxID=1855725 RepID=A0ABW5XTY1_9SPHI
MATNIIQKVTSYIKSLTGGGDKARTSKVNFNIGISFILRAISVVSAFATISYSIKLLDTDKYGIWLAISSTVGWISILDIGLANGLRNKVAEYLAVADYKSAKIDVSSAYAIMLLIMVPVMLIFCVVAPFINWNGVFNTKLNERELLLTLIVVFIGLGLQFILKSINSVLQGDQKVYKANEIALICNVSPLIPIIFGAQYLKGSILFLAMAQTLLPVLVMLVYSVVLYTRNYRQISPSLKSVDLKKSRSLFSLSFAFFIVQIARVFLISTTEIIITREFGGHDVTTYNLLFKYYSVTNIVINIIMGTYWNAFTNAFTLNDFNWIRASIKKLEKISLIFFGVIVMQVLLIKPVFHLWVGDAVIVPMALSLCMAASYSISLFTDLYVIVLNGTGKVKMQSIVTIITALLHIPVVLIMIRYFGWGVNSIVYATILWVIIQGFMWKREIEIILRSGELKAANAASTA